jgi:hypothetical protein
MTTRTCVLLLALLEPPLGRAMLDSGLVGVLLDEYEPVRGGGLQPLATVLGSAAAQRAGAAFAEDFEELARSGLIPDDPATEAIEDVRPIHPVGSSSARGRVHACLPWTLKARSCRLREAREMLIAPREAVAGIERWEPNRPHERKTRRVPQDWNRP